MRPPVLLAALLLLASACATTGSQAPDTRTALWIDSGLERVTVYLVRPSGYQERLATVMPGERRRIRLPVVEGDAYLVASTMRGRADFVTSFRPGGYGCWTWTLPPLHSAGPTFPVPCRGAR